MAKRKQIDESKALRPGWVPAREVKDEPPARSLNNQGAINGWIAKASARSGPAYAPGVGKSS
jgi:hypothetical protein